MLPEGQRLIGACGELKGTSASCLDETQYGVAEAARRSIRDSLYFFCGSNSFSPFLNTA